MKNREIRTFTLDSGAIEKRTDENGKEYSVARGHAAVFNKLSEDLGGFKEKIASDAFDAVLDDDVRALFNHDPNHLLGRTKSGTLRIKTDETGLLYEADLPDTQSARDLAVSMERGDITQSSFAFSVEKDSWEKDEDGNEIRTILKVGRLFDVSPVTYPAYPDATVGLRSLLAQYRTQLEQAEKVEKPQPVEQPVSGSDVKTCRARMRVRELNSSHA